MLFGLSLVLWRPPCRKFSITPTTLFSSRSWSHLIVLVFSVLPYMCADPKSTIWMVSFLTPAPVIIFDGFRSECTIPIEWTYFSVCNDCLANEIAWLNGIIHCDVKTAITSNISPVRIHCGDPDRQMCRKSEAFFSRAVGSFESTTSIHTFLQPGSFRIEAFSSAWRCSANRTSKCLGNESALMPILVDHSSSDLEEHFGFDFSKQVLSLMYCRFG